MKKYLGLILIFVTLFVSCNNETIVIYDISSEKFLIALAEESGKDTEYLVIDTRSEVEYNKGHIKNAINLPGETFKSEIDGIKDLIDLEIYVYDKTADLSYPYTKLLAKNGFKKLYNCEGTDEHKYEFVQYRTVRVHKFFELAKNTENCLIDYRIKYGYDEAHAENAYFLAYGNIKAIPNSIPFSKSYMIYSTTEQSAVDCAKAFLGWGFKNVYVCREGIMDHMEYLTVKKDFGNEELIDKKYNPEDHSIEIKSNQEADKENDDNSEGDEN